MYCLLLALFCLGLIACSGDTEPQLVLGTLEWDRVELRARESEIITEAVVKQGQRVESQQLLLQLDSTLAQTRLDGAIAARERARARLDEVLRGPRVQQVVAARAVREGAESQLLEAELEVKRQQNLVDKKLASKATLDRVIALRDSKLAARDSASEDLKLALEGSSEEEIRQARSALEVAQAEAAAQVLRLQRLAVRAPVAGVVESLPLKTGSQPRIGEVVVVLLAGQPYARAYLPEPLKSGVSVGSQFLVSIDGIEKPLKARVRYLSREAAFTPYFSLAQRDRSRLVFVMELEFEDPQVTDLAAGLPLQVWIPDSTR